MEDIYVQGGVYTYLENGKKVKRFALVRPSGDSALPYIWKEQWRSMWSCRHHSHCYKVTSNLNLILVEESWEAPTVEAPEHVILSDELRDELRQSIERGTFY